MDNFTKLKRLIFGAITNKVDESFAMTMSSYFIKKLSNPQFKSAIVSHYLKIQISLILLIKQMLISLEKQHK